MTLDERMRAAEDALVAMVDDYDPAQVEAVVKAFAPELFTSPPTMWLAPMEASEEMVHASWIAPNPLPVIEPRERRTIFRLMRDAHLNREGK